MREIDIWRAADEMIDAYGEDADLHASMRAQKATDKADRHEERLWNRVTLAILDLTRQGPGAGQSLN